LQIEHADFTLIGDREDNQDRVTVVKSEHAVFLAVIDGMGGHSDGSRAAETALKSMVESFWQASHPLFDPLGFLHMTLSKAHDDVVRLGQGLSIDARPRATTAVCLVQEGAAYWAHVGDSRTYFIRHGQVAERTRDHSHVELLLREGKILEEDIATHPMRNFVECCLGGDPSIPEMTISSRHILNRGDVVLLCTDGIWANLRDAQIGGFLLDDGNLETSLQQLGRDAVVASAPFSDNSTLAALRWVST
jgi:serine/threonine protein phosphatase PrpC